LTGSYIGDSDLNESAVPNLDPQRIQWPADGMHTSNDLSFAPVAAPPFCAPTALTRRSISVGGWWRFSY